MAASVPESWLAGWQRVVSDLELIATGPLPIGDRPPLYVRAKWPAAESHALVAARTLAT